MNPSYNNLGGSGSRCSKLVGGGYAAPALAGTITAGVISIASSPYTTTDAANNCMVAVTWSGRPNPVYCAIIAAVNGTSITVGVSNAAHASPASGWDAVAGAFVQLPTAATSVSVGSGGPYLLDVIASDDVMYYGANYARDLCNGLAQPNVQGGSDGLNPANPTLGGNAVTSNSTIVFDFGATFPTTNMPSGAWPQKYITEFTWRQLPNTGGHGVWTMEASNDGTNYVRVDTAEGHGFTLGGAANGLTVQALAPAQGYRYYRLRGYSGTTNSGNVYPSIYFKIDDYSTSSVATPSPYTYAQAKTFQAIEHCYSVGASPLSPEYPAGIVFADDFSSGWTLLHSDSYYGTLAMDYAHVRMGTSSIAVTSAPGNTSSANQAAVTKEFNTPIDLSNTDVVLGLALSAWSSPAVMANLVVTLWLWDVNGNYYAYNRMWPSCYTAQSSGNPGWVPRCSHSISLGANTAATISPGFDITKVSQIAVQAENVTSPYQTFTMVFDSLIFAKKPPCALISLRSDAGQGRSTLMLEAYLSANYPQIKVCNDDCVVFLDSIGGMIAGLTSQLENGHRLMNYVDFLGYLPTDVDLPMSTHSRVGSAVWQRYVCEALGFPSADMRVAAAGTAMEWSTNLSAAMAPYFDCLNFPGPASDNRDRPSQYVTEYIDSSQEIQNPANATDIAHQISDLTASCGAIHLFGHIKDEAPSGVSTTLAGWQAANWSLSYIQNDRPDLYNAIQVIINSVVPALAAGAKMVTVGQFAKVAADDPIIPSTTVVLASQTAYGWPIALQAGGVNLPLAKYVYAGQNRGDGVNGTLHASTIAAAAGAGVNLSAGILVTGSTVDDVVGNYPTTAMTQDAQQAADIGVINSNYLAKILIPNTISFGSHTSSPGTATGSSSGPTITRVKCPNISGADNSWPITLAPISGGQIRTVTSLTLLAVTQNGLPATGFTPALGTVPTTSPLTIQFASLAPGDVLTCTAAAVLSDTSQTCTIWMTGVDQSTPVPLSAYAAVTSQAWHDLIIPTPYIISVSGTGIPDGLQAGLTFAPTGAMQAGAPVFYSGSGFYLWLLSSGASWYLDQHGPPIVNADHFFGFNTLDGGGTGSWNGYGDWTSVNVAVGIKWQLNLPTTAVDASGSAAGTAALAACGLAPVATLTVTSNTGSATTFNVTGIAPFWTGPIIGLTGANTGAAGNITANAGGFGANRILTVSGLGTAPTVGDTFAAVNLATATAVAAIPTNPLLASDARLPSTTIAAKADVAVTTLGLTAVTQVYINNTGTPMDTVFNLFLGVIQNGRPVMYSAGNNNAVYWSLGLGAWVAAPSPAGSITDVPTNYFLGGTGAYPSNDLWVGRGAYSGKSTRPNVIGVIPTLQEIMQALI